MVAGCRVVKGLVTRSSHVRVVRNGKVIHTGSIGSLRVFKDDVKEVGTGFECGIGLAGFNDMAEGDIIEAYELIQVEATL